MHVLRKKIKNHDQGKYKLEKKLKAVAGVRDIGMQLKYGDLFESYTVTTGAENLILCFLATKVITYM